MAKEPALAESASTWMQVVFGGLGLSVAIVGAVIAYFAWVQPHSSSDDRTPGAQPAAAAGPAIAGPATTGPAKTGPAVGGPAVGGPAVCGPAVCGPAVGGPATKQVRLGSLPATTGSANIQAVGADLTMPCATGQSVDRLRTVEYDLGGHYTALSAGLTVTKAHDGDTALRVAVFLDDRQVSAQTLTKSGAGGHLDVPLTGGDDLRVQLICQLPDGEVRLDAPTLTHS